MMSVIQANIVPILIAVLVGLLIGWWMWRRAPEKGAAEVAQERSEAVPPPAAPTAPAPVTAVPSAPKPEPRREHEGHGIADQGVAATTDVAGQMLGVNVHAELPGAGGPPDNLQLLKGVGPKLAAKLNEHGITRFAQIARLSDNEVAILEDQLGPFKGRLTRDRVVEQAFYLARNDIDGFEARFGKLGG